MNKLKLDSTAIVQVILLVVLTFYTWRTVGYFDSRPHLNDLDTFLCVVFGIGIAMVLYSAITIDKKFKKTIFVLGAVFIVAAFCFVQTVSWDAPRLAVIIACWLALSVTIVQADTLVRSWRNWYHQEVPSLDEVTNARVPQDQPV